MSYTAVYEREPDGRWTVVVREVRGCHSYGRTIDQARERIREALGLFVNDAETADIVDDVRLPADLRRHVKVARELREKVAAGQQEMVKAQLKAVRALRAIRLGHRDAGQLLGLSHQRVQQLEGRRIPHVAAAVAEHGGTTRHVPRRMAAKKR